MSCNHPKSKVVAECASYRNDEDVHFTGWEYVCLRCKARSRFISGVMSLGCPNYFEYKLFTGRAFEDDYQKELKKKRIQKAKQKIREGLAELKREGA